jgi:hypothetical protein
MRYPKDPSEYCYHTEWTIINDNEDKDYQCTIYHKELCYGNLDCPDYKPRKGDKTE